MNKVILMGNMGKDPELDYKDFGPICKFPLATTCYHLDIDGKDKNKTEWHNVVCFGKLAEYVGEYMRKGSRALIEGKIQYDSWEGSDEKPITKQL